MRFISVFIIFFFNISAHSAENLAKILPEFESYIQDSLSEWQAPGVAVVIVQDGKIVYEKAFGITNINNPHPLDVHTIFPLASLSKNFLVTLIAKLVDEGILQWDKPVKYYLPDFKLSDSSITEQFTLRDLISHRSGLKAFSADTLWNLDYDSSEIKQGLTKLPFVSKFRQDYAYQNHLFGIASDLVEKVTGQPIKILFQNYLFKPLDLKEIFVGPMVPSVKNPWYKSMWCSIKSVFKKPSSVNVAIPHHVIEGKTASTSIAPQFYSFIGSTGLSCSIHTLGHWMIFQLNNGIHNGEKIISSEQLDQMRTAHVQANTFRPEDIQFPALRMSDNAYGMGWFISRYGQSGSNSVEILHHMGGFGGVRSSMVLIPQHNVGIAILSNFGSMRVSMLPEGLRNKFLDLYLGIPNSPDWTKLNHQKMEDIRHKNKDYKNSYRLQNPRPAHDLKVYIGKYTNDLYGEFEIQQDQKGLILVYRNRRIRLNHWNADEFEFKGNDLSSTYSDYDQGYIEFAVKGQKAMLSAINLMQEGQNKIFNRILP